MTSQLTELSGNFAQDKRLIKLMLAHLAKYANDNSQGQCRLKQIMLTMGAQGVLIYNNDGPEGQVDEEEKSDAPRFQHIPAQAVPQETIESVMGAGDSFVAGYIAGIVNDFSFDRSIEIG